MPRWNIGGYYDARKAENQVALASNARLFEDSHNIHGEVMTNWDFFGGKTREQDPIYSTQLHLIYEFRGGAWLAFNANYYTGGRSSVNGVAQNDELDNSRFGVTLALPWDRLNSLKLNVSKGVLVRAGDDFTTFGLAWQHRWGGGL